MTPLRIGIAAGLGGLLLLICTPALLFSTIANACIPPTTPTSAATTPSTNPPNLSDLDARQAANAVTIHQTAIALNLPARAAVIAIATAIQESNLRNLANSNVPASLQQPHEGVGHDHDSVGLFQQRPLPPDGDGTWGTVAELMTPTIAATKFYQKMITITGWQSLPLTDVAQRVQRSAYPDAYATHEPRATAIITALAGGFATCDDSVVSAAGWTHPLPGHPIVSGFRTTDRPGHDGIDITAPKETPIRAAATGTVITVRCNASLNGKPYPCDQDGSPAVAGCGYYSEILTGRHVHRYCHQLVQPHVTVGQHVTAGQIIGLVGTSGNSSGPHLHWEIHDGNPATPDNAIDPVAFLRSVGITNPAS
ncbi:murein DD-endopeptidase MepM/ murein hydrolase activator NlpD [Micromonospora sp. Llam0]|uniref:M23 family metallopeptidase n=1 Tax=Micromonospora sp. Llam0 TaxID=2485143 RepID=UPI000F4A6EFF|nr:M23 family metallopeptidase [Micromonospora sp. Llam0]ROO60346.1 murein DD-endopeptidase MepM/ murein hydrolase activator NlpD [Micromonospora sp. Llam0]